mmetsp:Transcript_89251/g.207691  ORF Transcript_89251/g.207691 Transcript_89251/m.207691 type:complete len:265 (-) Transcript_89251:404-1198(-)
MLLLQRRFGSSQCCLQAEMAQCLPWRLWRAWKGRRGRGFSRSTWPRPCSAAAPSWTAAARSLAAFQKVSMQPVQHAGLSLPCCRPASPHTLSSGSRRAGVSQWAAGSIAGHGLRLARSNLSSGSRDTLRSFPSLSMPACSMDCCIAWTSRPRGRSAALAATKASIWACWSSCPDAYARRTPASATGTSRVRGSSSLGPWQWRPSGREGPYGAPCRHAADLRGLRLALLHTWPKTTGRSSPLWRCFCTRVGCTRSACTWRTRATL